MTLCGIVTVHSFPKGRGDKGGIELTFDLRVWLVGRTNLEIFGADASSFLSDAVVDRWSGGVDNDGLVREERAGR